jgi:hypothetical protein
MRTVAFLSPPPFKEARLIEQAACRCSGIQMGVNETLWNQKIGEVLRLRTEAVSIRDSGKEEGKKRPRIGCEAWSILIRCATNYADIV